MISPAAVIDGAKSAATKRTQEVHESKGSGFLKGGRMLSKCLLAAFGTGKVATSNSKFRV
jgi:hypothetical protein